MSSLFHIWLYGAQERVAVLLMDNKLPLANVAAVSALAAEGCRLVYQVLKKHVERHSVALKTS